MGRGRPYKCPYCEATENVAKGYRYNKTGKVKLRRCKACGRRWTTGLAAVDAETVPAPGNETENAVCVTSSVDQSSNKPDFYENANLKWDKPEDV